MSGIKSTSGAEAARSATLLDLKAALEAWAAHYSTEPANEEFVKSRGIAIQARLQAIRLLWPLVGAAYEGLSMSVNDEGYALRAMIADEIKDLKEKLQCKKG